MAFVLIVEDNDSVAPLEIALASLKAIGTMVVANGREALKVLDACDVELAAVITDLHLPFVDGFELVAAIRAHHRYLRLPIIVVSGDTDYRNRSRVQDLGANAYFAKPYSPTQVRQTLEGLLYAP